MIKIKKLLHLVLRLLFGNIRYARFLGVRIGDNCRIYLKEFGSEPFLISIGNNVTITHNVHLITHDGSLDLVTDENGRRFSYKPIVIGNNVFIGYNTIVLPGTHICDNVVIGAGSVITKDILESGVYVGNPARRIKSFDRFQTKYMEYPSFESLKRFKNYKERVYKAIELEGML